MKIHIFLFPKSFHVTPIQSQIVWNSLATERYFKLYTVYLYTYSTTLQTNSFEKLTRSSGGDSTPLLYNRKRVSNTILNDYLSFSIRNEVISFGTIWAFSIFNEVDLFRLKSWQLHERRNRYQIVTQMIVPIRSSLHLRKLISFLHCATLIHKFKGTEHIKPGRVLAEQNWT